MLNLPKLDFSALALDSESASKRAYEHSKSNENNFSFWREKINNKLSTIKLTYAEIYTLNLEYFDLITTEKFVSDATFPQRFEEYIQSLIANTQFKSTDTIFIKSGTFSGKFWFEQCQKEGLEGLSERIIRIFYDSMSIGAGEQSEFVLQTFINPVEKCNTIYRGMPLRTEFRAFYDFTKHEFLGLFPYWDSETMLKHLKNTDRESFLEVQGKLEQEFATYSSLVIDMLTKDLKNVSDLSGIWSIDIMKNGDEYYLIDMAIGSQSYYYERLNIQTEE